jgi:hypothetical protein
MQPRLWEFFIEEAKKNVGTDDWDDVVKEAKSLASDTGKSWHERYINSVEWKAKSLQVLSRDNRVCKDCGGLASVVHHTTYDFCGCRNEVDWCVSLCRLCHARRHNKH